MAKSLQTLRSDFRKEVPTDPNGKIWKNAAANDMINQGYLRIQVDGDFNWPENEGTDVEFSTVAGTAEYSLSSIASNFGALEMLFLDITTEMSPIDFKQAIRQNPSRVQAKPAQYYLRGGKIGFESVPDNAYTAKLYYRIILAPLASDSAEIAFPDSFGPAIVKYAAYLAWSRHRGNKNTALEKFADYNLIKDDLFGAYMRKDDSDLNYLPARDTRNINYPNRLPTSR